MKNRQQVRAIHRKAARLQVKVKKEGRDKKAKNQNVKRKGKRNISINIEN